MPGYKHPSIFDMEWGENLLPRFGPRPEGVSSRVNGRMLDTFLGQVIDSPMRAAVRPLPFDMWPLVEGYET